MISSPALRSGDVVLVTGAGSGLGRECALTLSSAGYRVYGSVFDAPQKHALEQDAAARDKSLHPLEMDVTKPQDVDRAVRKILDEAGRIDAVVHLAGVGLRGFFEDLTLDEIRDVYEVNVFGTMNLLKAVLPAMRAANRGRIVITTSIAGRIGSMSISGYASSKFAVEGLAECVAQEVALFGVSVSVLEPGLILTEHFTKHRNRAKRAVDPSSVYYPWFCQHEKIVDDLLARQAIAPADVASVVSHLLKVKRPRFRYVLGTKPRIIVSLRRHIPGEWFDRVYFSLVRRLVVSPRKRATSLSV